MVILSLTLVMQFIAGRELIHTKLFVHINELEARTELDPSQNTVHKR